MPTKLLSLTPDALLMMDAIARNGSFAAAARELGRVPSALTYSVRQLEESLDVLLFDRRTGQAKLTPAGQELLTEGRRLLVQLNGVANRVRRVATGWEAELTLAVDGVLCARTVMELVQAFYSQGEPPTRLKCGTEVLAGTWEALISGQADLAVGVALGTMAPPPGVELEPLGELPFVYTVAPHHPLAARPSPLSDEDLLAHRAVAVADTAASLSPLTVNLLPGQSVLTVSSTQDKLQALLLGLGGGFLPQPLVAPWLRSGHLVEKALLRPAPTAAFGYAWRRPAPGAPVGHALQWWLNRLASDTTRQALLQPEAGVRA